jgi:putative tricarboxylic transport membrane protein
MRFKKYNDLILGTVMLAFALIYFVMTMQIPRKAQAVDATFVPYILCFLLAGVGIFQTIRGLGAARSYDSSTYVAVRAEDAVDVQTVVKTVSLIILYVMLLNVGGFIIMSTLYLFFQFIVLTPDRLKKNYVMYGIIAALSSVIIFAIFRYGFELMLPAGILG